MKLAIWLVAATAFCQDRPECATAAQRLHSEVPSEKAWGAYLAADCHLIALTSDIVDQLTEGHPDQPAGLLWDSESFWMAHAFLDALIRSDASLNESTLASIASGFPAEGAILMLQDAHANRSLLADLRNAHPGGAEWVAASNALVSVRAEGFAATLLHEIQITHSFWVTESGEIPASGMAGSLGSGNPALKVPPGFPPVPLYRLTATPAADDRLVSDGAAPIYSQRAVFQPGIQQTLHWAPEGHCFQCLRISYLSELAYASRPEIARSVEPRTPIRWSDLAHLNADAWQAIADQIAAMKGLAKLLISAGALRPSELDLPLKIEVRIEDQRQDRSQPIPAIDPVPFSIRP